METSSALPSSRVSPPRSSASQPWANGSCPRARSWLPSTATAAWRAAATSSAAAAAKPGSGPAASDEIARDGDDVGLELRRPARAAAQQRQARAEACVHVGDVQDREPVEIAREAGQRKLAHPPAQRQRLRVRTPRRPPRPPRRGLYANASSIGIVAAATLQVGRDEGDGRCSDGIGSPRLPNPAGRGRPFRRRPPPGRRAFVSSARSRPAGNAPAPGHGTATHPRARGPRAAPTPRARRRQRRDRRWGESPACAPRRGRAACARGRAARRARARRRAAGRSGRAARGPGAGPPDARAPGAG